MRPEGRFLVIDLAVFSLRRAEVQSWCGRGRIHAGGRDTLGHARLTHVGLSLLGFRRHFSHKAVSVDQNA